MSDIAHIITGNKTYFDMFQRINGIFTEMPIVYQEKLCYVSLRHIA